MENEHSQTKSPFATEPVGRLIARFAIPCVISLLVNSLYNIVDQIFIGWGVGYLGNGATNVVFPITIVALALSLMIGDGGAAYLSLKLGEKDVENARRGAAIATVMGQVATFIVSVVYLFRFKNFRIALGDLRLRRRTCLQVLSFGISSFITQIAITIVMALSNNLLASYGAQSVYGSEIPLTAMGIVMKVNQILISILAGISTGAQPIIGFNYSAKDYHRVRKAFDISLVASEIVAVIGFCIFQFAPMSVVSLFGSEDALYNEFAVRSFRTFLLLCPLTGFQTVAAIYLQAVGKPVNSAILSLSRQIIFFVPAALLLPRFLGVAGVLWTGPVADGLAFVLALGLILYERKQLKTVPEAR